MPRIHVAPAAERELADSGPEGTLCEAFAAAAAIAAYQAPGPQVHYLTEAVDPGEGGQHPPEDRAPTSTDPSDVQHGHRPVGTRALLRHVCTFVLGCDCLEAWPSVSAGYREERQRGCRCCSGSDRRAA